MNPIDNLLLLSGLKLNFLLHFQNPDEVLSNRDDELFVERLRSVNAGNTKVITGFDKGHAGRHTVLWDYYKRIKLPGKIISHDQETKIPIVSLNSLDLRSYKILKIFNSEDLPAQSNWHEHSFYYTNRNRTVYLTNDEKYTIKIWQKGYTSQKNFLDALHAKFFNNIALILALVFDEENECRGYILPYMTDRTFNRSEWESFGFVLEKGLIGVKIFSHHTLQPDCYQQFFNALVHNAQVSGYVSLDFCPNNIAVDAKTKKVYLFDLEDVLPIAQSTNQVIQEIFFNYLSYDYIEKIDSL